MFLHELSPGRARGSRAPAGSLLVRQRRRRRGRRERERLAERPVPAASAQRRRARGGVRGGGRRAGAATPFAPALGLVVGGWFEVVGLRGAHWGGEDCGHGWEFW